MRNIEIRQEWQTGSTYWACSSCLSPVNSEQRNCPACNTKLIWELDIKQVNTIPGKKVNK